MRLGVLSGLVMVVLLIGCREDVLLEAQPDAVVGCDPATEYELTPTARMLPGRLCQSCHIEGSQASRRIWTASGTVYGKPDAKCNEGLEGIQVEFLDERDQIFLTLTTNRSGNFFTAEPIEVAHFRVRLSKDGRKQEMQGLQPTGACAGCHYPNSGSGAPGRVYWN